MEVNKHRFVNKTQELQSSPVKLSVKGLFRYPVKCFEWKTSAVVRSSNYYKLRKSSRWSSSFVPSSFSNSSRKQWTVCFPIVMWEIRRFSWATILQVFTKPSYSHPLFCRFLRPETEHSGTCFAVNSNFVWFFNSHFPVVWCFDSLLFY